MLTENVLDAPLANLELALETPVVPGELKLWIDVVATAFGALDPVLLRTMTREHQRLFDAIADEDPELLAHVTQMRKHDEEIRAGVAAFRDKLVDLYDAHGRVKSEDPRIEPLRQEIVHLGLHLVIGIRTQEAEIVTWFAEALHRDRGVVD